PEEEYAARLRRSDLHGAIAASRLREPTPIPNPFPPLHSIDEFPPAWREPRRPDSSRFTVSSQDRKLIEAIERGVTIELEDSTLEAVVAHLRERTAVRIELPKALLEEKGFSNKTSMSITLKHVSLRTVLKKVAAKVDMTYVIRHGAIELTTEERAQE